MTETFPDPVVDTALTTASGNRTAVLAGGCFWCTEAVYRQLQGIIDVRSGYAGGTAETANYRAVCSGTTDHAEAIEIRYDPHQISFGQLLKVFFSVAHDPTQLDRQGNDRGRQYRSSIFCATDEERRVAEAYIQQLEGARLFSQKIVTRVEPLDAFYVAEDYHQDYAARNPQQPYICAIAAPKVEKVRKQYPEKMKG